MTTGNSKGNAIVIDALDSIAGVTEEHKHLNLFCSTLDTGVESIDQSLIIENGKQYDKFVIQFEDGSERILYFDITSFFGKI